MVKKIDFELLKILKDAIFYILIPIIILIFGIAFNLIGIFVYRHKRIRRLNKNLKNIYLCLFTVDTLVVAQILVMIIFVTFKFDIVTMTNQSCKVYRYINYAVSNISPYILIYISLDRYISIKYPNKRFMLKKPIKQNIFIISLIVFQLVYYLPIIFFYENLPYSKYLEDRNISKVSSEINVKTFIICECSNQVLQKILAYMAFINRMLIPTLLMAIISLKSIFTLFESTNKMKLYKKTSKSYRDIKFTSTSLILNASYIILALPVSLIVIKKDYYDDINLVLLFGYLYYISYGINFLIIWSTNTFMRREIKKIITRK